MTLSDVLITPDHPGFVLSSTAVLEGSAARLQAGAHECFLYGPYIAATAGVYRVCAIGKVIGPQDARVFWDVYADGRVFASQSFHHDGELFVRLPNTNTLEFRFTGRGAEMFLEGVEIQPLLLDAQDIAGDIAEKLIERIQSAAGDPEAAFHLINRLAEAGEIATAERLRRTFVPKAPRPAPTLDLLFQAINTPGYGHGSPFEGPVDQEAATVAVAGQSLTFIDVVAMKDEDRATLVRYGYQPAALHATRLYRSYALPRRPWQNQSASTPAGDRPDPLPAMSQGLASVDFSFQTDLARGEGMTAYCPVTGAPLKSHHAFCWQFYGLAQTFHRFEGIEVFYLVTGGFPNSRMFLYLPKSGLVAVIEEPVLRWYPYDTLIKEFNAALLQAHGEVHNYLRSSTKPAAVYGGNNLGHYFWNDMGGLQYAADAGLFPEIVQTVELTRQYIDARLVFPELRVKTNVACSTPLVAFRHCLENHLLPIRFTDAEIRDDLVARVKRAAAENSTADQRPPINAPRPLIWVNLRAHNKIWLDQVSGSAKILNSVYEVYGAAAALLDGTPDCADVAAAIRKETRPEIPLYDGLNFNIYDTLNWAFAIDAFVCAVGSGLAIVNWLANKPGVTHAEHAHMAQLVWWNHGRPAGVQPLQPAMSDIVDVGEGWYCNYEVDWQILFQRLQQALESRPPESPDA